ncbi:MAG: hypothetical protein ACI9XK_001605 [Granulosicoccus sp.]|jgi:hypothetical protein
MFKRLPTRFSLIAVLLGLTACATVPQGSAQISDQPIPSGITSKVSLGSMIAVPPGVGVEGNQARVVDEYYSASGRHCVRVELKQAGSSTRVICQRESGNWSFTRSLFNDQIPVDSDELLITTPFNAIESNAAELMDIDQSSVADKLGAAFETHYTLLPAFDGDKLWNFAGTSTAGPAMWKQSAMASASGLSDLVGHVDISELITGRR